MATFLLMFFFQELILNLLEYKRYTLKPEKHGISCRFVFKTLFVIIHVQLFITAGRYVV
jgi:hypothetical protein